MNYSVTRKAILIGCAGSDNNFLHGVEEDLTNMKNFLLSDKGGRWFPDEIATFAKPEPVSGNTAGQIRPRIK